MLMDVQIMPETEQLEQELQEARRYISELESQINRYKKQSDDNDEAMQRYHYLFEYASDSIFIVNPDTLQIMQANSSAARRLGYTAKALAKLKLSDIEYHPDPEGPKSVWESTFSNTRVYECFYRHKDGSLIPVEVSSRVIKIGEQLLTQNFVRDTRKRKEIEYEREHLIAELDAFAGAVAHDLKSPAGTIIMATHSLMDNADVFTPAKSRQYLEIIDRSANKVNQIIDGLLMLSSVRKQKDIPAVRLDMTAIVRDSIEALGMMVSEHRADIQIVGALPIAVGYAPWIEEVWTNYLSNAIKYGSKPPVIRIGGEILDSHMARYWVSDNGAGIPEALMSSLFNEFTRLDRTQISGTGLGLSIVQRIVTRLGGEVDAVSTPGQGSTFSFTLPLVKPPSG